MPLTISVIVEEEEEEEEEFIRMKLGALEMSVHSLCKSTLTV